MSLIIPLHRNSIPTSLFFSIFTKPWGILQKVTGKWIKGKLILVEIALEIHLYWQSSHNPLNVYYEKPMQGFLFLS